MEEFIDEHPVVSYRVRFKDRAEVSEVDAVKVRDGNVMVWLVRAVCLPPSYHAVAREAEERYRFNVQAVQQAVPLAGDVKDSALTYLAHGTDQGYLSFGPPRYTEAGLFDPETDGAAARQLADARAVLAERQLIEDGESVAQCLARVLWPPEPVEPSEEVKAESEAARQFFAYSTGGVEVVGSIYRNGPSPDRKLIEEAFSDQL